MMYAETAGGRAEAAKGLQGTCPSCSAPVRPKCGSIVVWHWAHLARAQCDPWAEPDTEWHRGWQLAVPPERREVVMGPHRADVVTHSGGVVELQRSAISPEVIRAREEFYGEHMAWIFDAVDAARCGRLTVKRTTAGQFRWMNPRKSVAACNRTVLLDLGTGELLRLDSFSPKAPAGGRGRLITRESVEAWMRDGSPWQACPVPPDPIAAAIDRLSAAALADASSPPSAQAKARRAAYERRWGWSPERAREELLPYDPAARPPR